MKVLNYIIRYPPATGGAENLVKNVCENLIQYNYGIKVITSDLKQHIDFIKFTEADFAGEVDTIHVKRFNSIKIPGILYPVMPGMLIASRKESPDIIHNWTIYFPSIAGTLTGLFKKIPVVINPIIDYNNIAYRKLYRMAARFLIGKADAVIVLTEYSKKVIESFNIKYKRLFIIPPGINYKEFENIKHNYLEKFSLKGKIILYSGRLASGKGLDILLKAFKIVLEKDKNVILCIAGEDFGFKKWILDFAEENRIRSNVIISGKLSREDYISCLKNADVFVLPSRYETFGIVLIESMFCRTPVIGMDNSAIPYVIDNEKTGILFRNEDKNDLAEKIIEVLNNNKLRDSLTENGYNFVMRNHQWKDITEKIKNVYEEVYNNRLVKVI